MTDRDLIRELAEALDNLHRVIESAGLGNLADGVQVGRIAWFVTATDAMDISATALTAARNRLAREDQPAADAERHQIALREWAVARWRAEVEHRPLVNKNRRSLDDTWRQVMRYAGLDPDEMVGPSHDALLAAQPAAVSAQAVERAWLVEWRFNGIQWLYLWPRSPGGFTFTGDANKALRFARREDAEAALQWARDTDAKRGAGRATGDLLVTEHEWPAAQPAPEPAEPVAPMFWVRLRSNGLYEGPIHNAQIEKVRRESGAWSPLYLGAAPPSPAPVALSDADLMEIAGMSGWPESMLAPVILAKLREYGRAVEAECRRRMMGE